MRCGIDSMRHWRALQDVASARLATNATDRDALFAMTLSSGLPGRLRGIDRKAQYVFFALHARSQRLGGQTVGGETILLRCPRRDRIQQIHHRQHGGSVGRCMGGVSGDKKQGVVELQMTADHGRYLWVHLRGICGHRVCPGRTMSKARELLANLRDEFPRKKYVVSREIARLDAGH